MTQSLKNVYDDPDGSNLFIVINNREGYSVFDEKGNAVFPVPKSYTKGTKVELNNATLYVSATAASGTKRSGTYYIYDGNVVNGRYRITTKAEYCGKTPAGKYVTGWVNKADML